MTRCIHPLVRQLTCYGWTAVNHTRPSKAGLTSRGPEPSGTGKASIVNTGSTRTATVVMAEVVPLPLTAAASPAPSRRSPGSPPTSTQQVSRRPRPAAWRPQGSSRPASKPVTTNRRRSTEPTTTTTVTTTSEAARPTHPPSQPSSQVDPADTARGPVVRPLPQRQNDTPNDGHSGSTAAPDRYRCGCGGE